MNKTLIRTLSDKDASILARSSVKAIVSKGYVERHGLRWSSHALREWELVQRNLNRKPEVELLIDELDLAVVFVQLPAPNGQIIHAVSTQPQYTRNLSLFEHEKLKAALKKKHLEFRLGRMADQKLYELRLEYYAMLGRQEDPVSRRRLEKLRDELASSAIGKAKLDKGDVAITATEQHDDGSSEVSSSAKPALVPRVSETKTRGSDKTSSASKAATPPPQSAKPKSPNDSGQSISTPRLGSQSAPNFPSKSVRRTPK